jgi:hypothetical protein
MYPKLVNEGSEAGQVAKLLPSFASGDPFPSHTLCLSVSVFAFIVLP